MNEQVKTCPKHPESKFYVAKRKANSVYMRCKACNVEHVTERRRKVKRLLVERAGGQCVKCGYSRCVGAMEFHHPDPSKKEFSISAEGSTRGIDKAWVEASKCLLLCSNCHREIHAGYVGIEPTLKD